MENKEGFTLIELVVVLALIGIVLSMIFSPIIFSFKNFNTQNEKSNTISNARATMDYLTREIRKADSVEIIDGNLILDSNIFKLEDRILYKNDKQVMEGIDKLNVEPNDLIVNKVDETITIEINIRDIRGKDYRLSSDIRLR